MSEHKSIQPLDLLSDEARKVLRQINYEKFHSCAAISEDDAMQTLARVYIMGMTDVPPISFTKPRTAEAPTPSPAELDKDLALTLASKHVRKELGAMHPNWEPKAWVIGAIMEAHALARIQNPGEVEFHRGYTACQAEMEARNSVQQEAMDEHYRGAQSSIIRATVAAVMEAFANGVLEKTVVVMDLEAQRTIWDRYELTTERVNENTAVKFTLTGK